MLLALLFQYTSVYTRKMWMHPPPTHSLTIQHSLMYIYATCIMLSSTNSRAYECNNILYLLCYTYVKVQAAPPTLPHPPARQSKQEETSVSGLASGEGSHVNGAVRCVCVCVCTVCLYMCMCMCMCICVCRYLMIGWLIAYVNISVKSQHVTINQWHIHHNWYVFFTHQH